MKKNYDGVRVLSHLRDRGSRDFHFGRVVYQPGGYTGPRVQRDYELIILHSGEAHVELDGSPAKSLKIESITLFYPGHHEYFRYSATHDTHHSWCAVAPRRIPPEMARELERAPFSVPNTDLFKRLFSSLFQIPPDRTPETHRVIDQLVILLFAEFLRLAEVGDPKNRPDEPLRKALGHMEAHLEAEDCLAGACQAAGLSHSALIYHFRRKFNLSPSRYLWKLRTERGIAMLSQTGLTIGEIAYKCGFKNPFHFSRLVKQHQGIPPREVRNCAWA